MDMCISVATLRVGGTAANALAAAEASLAAAEATLAAVRGCAVEAVRRELEPPAAAAVTAALGAAETARAASRAADHLAITVADQASSS